MELKTNSVNRLMQCGFPATEAQTIVAIYRIQEQEQELEQFVLEQENVRRV